MLVCTGARQIPVLKCDEEKGGPEKKCPLSNSSACVSQLVDMGERHKILILKLDIFFVPPFRYEH
jgi:hypothetical protein